MSLFSTIKKYLYRFTIRNKRVDISTQMSSTELENRHIQNARLLSNRIVLLSKFKSEGTGAEIGVDLGIFAETIFKVTQPQKLHLVDVWDTERFNKEHKEQVQKNFIEQITKGKVEINEGVSYQIAQIFPDKYFDWIYIDTDHSYDTTIRELRAFESKMKPEGIIAGHDFIEGNWESQYRYGVIDAVYQFCVENDWEIIYLTLERKIHPSFAIRRIKN